MRLKTIVYNYYYRNIAGYIITMLVCSLTFFEGYRFVFTKQVIFGFLYYSFLYLFVFLHNKYLLDKLVLKNKIWAYLLILPIAFIVFVYVKQLLLNIAYPKLYLRYLLEGYYFILTLSLGSAIFLSTRYLFEKRNFFEITLLKREVELSQLKRQLNPHFLFNALNNIYSYNLRNGTHGNELIMKLAELMRFIVESSEKEAIPIEEELYFLENYIDFEKERLGGRCIIHYQRDLDYPKRLISPLLLFPFVENAFKYGANTIQKTIIDIDISDTQGGFFMSVKNSIINSKAVSTKTGVLNATKRLEMLYPGRHQLLITDTGDSFNVQLSIQYDEN
jgi:two-component system LytT family sensor kinase